MVSIISCKKDSVPAVERESDVGERGCRIHCMRRGHRNSIDCTLHMS